MPGESGQWLPGSESVFRFFSARGCFPVGGIMFANQLFFLFVFVYRFVARLLCVVLLLFKEVGVAPYPALAGLAWLDFTRQPMSDVIIWQDQRKG